MALSKLYTRLKLRSLIRELSKEVSEDKVQDPAVNEITDLNTLDLCEMLNGATHPDYGRTVTLSDAAGSAGTPIISSAAYTNSTKRVTYIGHELTSAHIGKRIALFGDSGIANYMGIGTVAAIISSSIFEVSFALGADIPSSSLYYVVLPAHSAEFLDLSSLKLDKIIKLVDSTHGLVPLKPAFDIENIVNLSHNTTEVFGYHEGEYIYLKKGATAAAWGTLTLHYYRLPDLPVNDTDYIDVKDKHIRLLVDKCVIDVFALAKMEAPSQLRENVDNRTQAIRQANMDKEVLLRTKQRT